MTTLPSSKLTITSVPSATETDSTIGGKRVEAIAQYFQDVWRIPQSRLVRMAKVSTSQYPAAAISHIGMEITTGLGLKQWELEFQQLVNNQLVTLKDTTGSSSYPERYLWRLNEEQGTIPQSNEPVNIRIAAYDVNNTAAPDAVLKSVRVEQVTMEQKRKANAQDKTVRNFDVLFGSSMTDLEPSSRVILDAVKKNITPQSKVFITVFGGTDDVNARKVAETLALDARSAVLRDAATSTTAQTPEAAAYGRLARIRVESPR
jgi:outer membrane protein OmpA-like peptidoglycan-associated protein